ncbi:MAG: hypothetical protein Q7U20_00630 [Caulobacter sp.]|nr:hypothetical protein [Caulobacter sp.]
MSTVQRAYALARSGQFRDVDVLKDRLKAEGCRAVDALLAARSIRKHLEAICAATFKPPVEAPAPAATPPTPATTPTE